MQIGLLVHFGYISYFANFHLVILIILCKQSNYIKLRSYGVVLLNLVFTSLMDMVQDYLKGLHSLSLV